MKRFAVIMTALLFSMSGVAQAADRCTAPEGNWKDQYPKLYTDLMGYFTCQNESDSQACNVFVGRAAEGVYHVTDFKRANGTYMMANDIYAYLPTNPTWSKLGMASDQSVLDNAAAGAQDHLIIAIAPGADHGHVALVLPGTPLKSDNWGMRVPNSASGFLNHVEKAYVFCRLAWAFSDKSNVEIWWRPKGS